jgi:putative membrane protein
MAEIVTGLNAFIVLVLIPALWAAKQGKIELHKKLILIALVASTILLGFWFYEKYINGSTVYKSLSQSPGAKVFLASHIISSVVELPFIVLSVMAGLKGRIAQHRKVAKLTALIWLYTSITGIILYFMTDYSL